MGRARVLIKLDERRQAELKEFIRHSGKHRERQRAQAILFLHQRETQRQTAELLGVEERSVRRWLRRYREGGMEGLRRRPHPKRKTKLSTRQKEALIAITRQSPESVGVDAGAWNCPVLGEWLKHTFNVRLSDEWIRQILLKHGLRFRRAKLKLTSPDPEYAQRKRRLGV